MKMTASKSKTSRGKEAIKVSYKVLKANPKLMLFPIISTGILFFLFGIIYAIAYYYFGIDYLALSPDTRISDSYSLNKMIGIFIYGFIVTYISIFFNIGLVYCVKKILKDEATSFAEGYHFAISRSDVILKWSLFSSTFGLILSLVHEKFGIVGRWVSSLIGVVWGIAVFFVIPILAFEDCGPKEALTKSANIMKEKWGESLVFNVGYSAIGLVGLLIGLPLAIFIGYSLSSYGAGMIAFFSLFFILMAIKSTTSSIYMTAAYLNINNNQEDNYFSQDILDDLFISKK